MRLRARFLVAAIGLFFLPPVSWAQTQTQDLVDRILAGPYNPPDSALAIEEIDRLDEAGKQALLAAFLSRFDKIGYPEWDYAAMAFGKLGARAIPSLIEKLADPGSPRTAKQVAGYGLGKIGDEAIPAILPLLKSRDLVTICYSALALGDMGEAARPAIPALAELLEVPDPQRLFRQCVITALGETKSPEAVPVLLKALPTEGTLVLSALGQMGTAAHDAIPEVIKLLDDPASVPPAIALNTLGDIGKGSPEAVAALEKAISDSGGDGAVAAAALVRIDPEEAIRSIPKMIALLCDARAVGALGAMGPRAKDAVPALMACWANNDVGSRDDLASVLKRIGPVAIPALIKGLKDSNPSVRSGAASQLGELHAAQAVDALIAALRDRDPFVRGSAAAALETIGTPRSKTAVEQFRARQSRPADPAQLRSLSAVLASEPRDELHRYPLELAERFEFKAPNGAQLLVTIHRGDERPDRLQVWRQVGNRYRLLKTMETIDPEFNSESFSMPESFIYHGESFLRIIVDLGRSGHRDTILWIAPDATLHDVKFVPGPDQYMGLQKGEQVYGTEGDSFSSVRMNFYFGVWTESDSVAVPSYEVRGTYQLLGQKSFNQATKAWSADFQIVPATFERRPMKNSQELDPWRTFEDNSPN